MVRNWAKRTPINFRFTAKFPKIITHDKKFKNVHNDLELFYGRMEPHKDKLLALLIQLPPTYKLKEGLEVFSSHDFSLKVILDMSQINLYRFKVLNNNTLDYSVKCCIAASYFNSSILDS